MNMYVVVVMMKFFEKIFFTLLIIYAYDCIIIPILE